MSRPVRPLEGAAAAARAELPDSEHALFDQLAHAMLASAAAPLGAVLRGRLPGGGGVRWLHREGLGPSARAADLTPAQWLSLYRCWAGSRPARGGAPTGGPVNGRPSPHGHAPGAMAAPRWF